MAELSWLRPDDPPDAFPPAEYAALEPNGLLAVGGDLSTERLLAAYRAGIFPWYDSKQPILWWSPDPRAVLLPGDLHISRSLRRCLRRNRYSFSTDQAFAAVISECAERRAATGTWITPELRAAFLALHELGHAHSVETWEGDRLVGGIYGLNIGRVFFGESMFSAARDASKVALAGLSLRCRELGVSLLDCQVPSPHLRSLGVRDMPRKRFLALLRDLAGPPDAGPWPQGRRPSDALA